jgi:hypothetical protein
LLIHINMKRLLLILIILFIESPVGATVYYIDPTCTTSGTGTSQVCDAVDGPFKTWAEVSWAAGNTYSQKGGTIAYEKITVGASGTVGNIITMNSYGTGRAIINGRVAVSPASWTGPDGGGVYTKASSYGVQFLLENSQFVKHSSSKANVGTDGNYWPYYYCGSGQADTPIEVDYYKPTGAFDANILYSARMTTIELGNNDYVTIDNLEVTIFFYGIGSTVSAADANTNIIIKNCYIHNGWIGIGLNARGANASNILVSNNTLDYIGAGIEFYEYNFNTNQQNEFRSSEISYNTISHLSQISGTSAYKWFDVHWGYGHSGNTNDYEGIGTQSLASSSIHHNTISGYGRGLVIYAGPYNSSYDNNIYANRITILDTLDSYGMVLTPALLSPGFYNNRVYYNIINSAQIAVVLSNVTTPSTTYNVCYNNTLISGLSIIRIGAKGDYWVIKNNIFYGAVNYNILYDDTPLTHIVYDYNLYYPATGDNGSMRFYYNPTQKTIITWKALGTDFDPNSPTSADPLFNNSAGGDYTLQFNSPAKDTGINVNLTSDYVGTPVPQGPGYDIGAYEFLYGRFRGIFTGVMN